MYKTFCLKIDSENIDRLIHWSIRLKPIFYVRCVCTTFLNFQ